MRRDPSAELSLAYRITLVGGVLLFFLIVAELARVQYASYSTMEVRILQQGVADYASSLESELRHVEAYVATVKQSMESAIASEEPPTRGAQLFRYVSRPGPEAAYSLGELPPALQKGQGSLFGLGPVPDIGSEGYREAVAALDLLPTHAAAHNVMPSLVRSFYLSGAQFVSAYPPLPPDESVTGEDGTSLRQALARPDGSDLWAQAGPALHPCWTPVHRPVNDRGLTVTCAAPVGVSGDVRGVVGVDVEIARLSDIPAAHSHPAAQLMLVGDGDRVLAHSGRVRASAADVPTPEGVLPPELRSYVADLRAAGEATATLIGDHHVVSRQIEAPSWCVLCLVPRRELLRDFIGHSSAYLIFIAALALYLLVLHVLIRNHFVRPSLALVDHIRTEATSGPTPIPNVPPAWQPWFKEISDIVALKTVAANLPGAIYQFVRRPGGRTELTFASAGLEQIAGVAPDRISTIVGREFDFIVDEDRGRMAQAAERSARDLTPLDEECRIRTAGGQVNWVRFIARPRQGETGEIIWDGLGLDVTARRKAEQERERLIKELQDAAAQIKTLRGLLPICASCKRVRDDTGYWKQIELHIREHSDAEFTHSICPECATQLYADYGGEPDHPVTEGGRNEDDGPL